MVVAVCAGGLRGIAISRTSSPHRSASDFMTSADVAHKLPKDFIWGFATGKFLYF